MADTKKGMINTFKAAKLNNYNLKVVRESMPIGYVSIGCSVFKVRTDTFQYREIVSVSDKTLVSKVIYDSFESMSEADQKVVVEMYVNALVKDLLKNNEPLTEQEQEEAKTELMDSWRASSASMNQNVYTDFPKKDEIKFLEDGYKMYNSTFTFCEVEIKQGA